MATTLAQPFLITAMIGFVQSEDYEATENTGYGLIAAFALNYSFLAIFSSWYTQSVARFSTKLRGCLISSIYYKTLQIASKDVNLGSATVLMNVDVEKVLDAVRYLHEFWAMIISASIASYILYTHLGASFVAPFITILVATAVSSYIGKLMKPRLTDWVVATEKRVTTIAYATGCIKGIRMLGLTETVLSMLTKLRELEVAAHRYVRKLKIWVLVISNVMFQLTSLATYLTFGIIALSKVGGPKLDFNTLFGSLSALKLVTSPMVATLQQLTLLQAGIASLERIQAYLRNDSVGLLADGSPPDGFSDHVEMSPLSRPHDSSEAIDISKGTFSVEEGKPLLFDINLRLNHGSFTMVIGKVGAGKSLLLRTLIGETSLETGSMRPIASTLAFCDQSVWLRNATVRENIIGEDELDRAWYETVTSACGLPRDFAEMKNGDGTVIGSKGVSLSGGQKNRISLARTLYGRRAVVIIDDVLSGLDNTTEKLVFDRVFGRSGLLRQSQTTVVLATHATYFARQVDRIIVMSAGRIVEDGTYEELATKNVDFQTLDGEVDEEAQDDELESTSDMMKSDQAERATTVSAEENIHPEEDDEDDMSRRSGDTRSLLFFLSAIGTFHCILYFILLVLATCSTTIQFLWLKWWAQSNSSSPDTIKRNLSIFVAITAVDITLTGIWLTHYALWFIPRASLALHARQLNALMRAKFSFLVSTDIGSITNRFSQDILLVDNQLQNAWINSTSAILQLITQVALLVVATPPVAATIPFLSVVGWVIQRVYLRTSRQVRLMDLEAKAPLCTHFLETLAGIVTIRSFGWVDAYKEKNDRYLHHSQIPFYLLSALQNWLNLVLELLAAGLVTVIVGLAVGLRAKVDPGFLGLALVAAVSIPKIIASSND